MNTDRVRRFSLSLQGWLAIIAVLAAAGCLYAAYAAPSREVTEGLALTGYPLCSSGSSAGAGKLDSSYTAQVFTIHYTDRRGDCNQASGSDAKRAGRALARARKQVLALGVRPPKEPIAVALWREPKNGSLQVFSRTGARGALVLDGETAQLDHLAGAGYAELALAQAAPGMTAPSRRRVAFALAVLAAGDARTITGTADSLSNGVASDSADGLYTAWLTAQLGPDFLRSTLAECRTSCNYAQVRDRELRRRTRDPRRMLEQFTSRAVAPGARDAFRARLRRP